MYSGIQNDSRKTYWHDLNIGGNRSLLVYVEGITSSLGMERLVNWLQNEAETEELINRQKAQRRLSEQVALRQDMNVYGREVGDISSIKKMNDWFKSRQVNEQANHLFKQLLLLWNAVGLLSIPKAFEI
ncbi:MAG: hypothetical protein P8Y42_22640 [Exilibacterium sp.]